MIEIIGDVRITREQAKDAYNTLRRACEENPGTCQGCLLSYRNKKTGAADCRINIPCPEFWKEWE